MRLQAATLRAKGEKRMTGTWGHMTACELGREIGKGRIHPVELTEAFLDAIESHPQASRIYARATPARARGEAMAAAARAKTGLRRGLLDGVPISWKDLFDTAGIATEAGSALLKHRTPTKDAAVLEVATLQGLVCLGKTHMSELAFSGLGLNPVTATPPCLNDDRAVPGGSSSGAAASVAFGLAPAAIGSDTFGSVRIPSAWNDLVGLKTTAGSLPLTGTVPLCERFDTIGPLAHSVEDCAHLHAALAGKTPADLTGTSLANARLAILETVALDDLRDRPAQGFDDAVARLSRAGAKIERIKAPEVTEVLGLAAILSAVEAYGIWRETIEKAPEKMFPRILDRFRSAAQFAATDYIVAWRRMMAIRAIWADRVAGFNAVLLPTAPILPPDANRLLTDDAYYVTENLLALRNTRIGSLMGVCALSLPTSQPSCGISLMAGAGEEGRLLRLGAAAERALR
jgi:aspartyl-tRNA(Asn)/glutamyl-tRNA(Gln) amidotransferase subunit A